MKFEPVPCPICGQTGHKEARMCPAEDSKGVCITCCKKCKNYIPDKSNPCGYYRLNNIVDYDSEIKKLNYQIEELRNKVRYYYQRGWKRAAENKEYEIADLLRKKRRLMEERNERNNKNSDTNRNSIHNNSYVHGA